jgi:hypothetical protein
MEGSGLFGGKEQVTRRPPAELAHELLASIKRHCPNIERLGWVLGSLVGSFH